MATYRIRYKRDDGGLPYCAYIENGPNGFMGQWSSRSYAAARKQLVNRLRKYVPPPPPDEEIEV